MNDCRESLVHVLGRSKEFNRFFLPEFLDHGQPSLNLVAHRRYDIVNWHHIFFIDQSFGPDLGVYFVTLL